MRPPSRQRHFTLIRGDGIGPEVTDATVELLDAAGADITWEPVIAGEQAVRSTGEVVPEAVLESIRSRRIALKGPITTPVGRGFRSANVTLRQELGLYACLRPVHDVPGIETSYGDVDVVVVRENTEGLYSGIEHTVAPGIVTSLKIMSHHACRRVSRFAFEYARIHGRRTVTAVHKANVMKMSDGLFLEAAREVAREYPYIRYEEKLLDNLAMELVLDPRDYDVLLLENLYGDIISDLCAGLVGGLGVVPGANIGGGYAVFEAVHGSAPDIAGQGVANPLAVMLSGVLMLEYVGLRGVAGRIRTALERVLVEGKVRTRDLGGRATTSEFTRAVIEALDPATGAAS